MPTQAKNTRCHIHQIYDKKLYAEQYDHASNSLKWKVNTNLPHCQKSAVAAVWHLSINKDGGDEENETDSEAGLTDGGDEENATESKTGLADAMAKILSKSVPQHKQVILAKGTTDRKLEKKRKKKEEEDEEKHEDKTSLEKKRLWEAMAKVKPDPLERDKERALQRIAQRGVVQLFNAVRKQQKILKEQLDDAGPTEAKKSKALGKMTKGKFLDLLKGQTVSNVSNRASNMKTEIKQENVSDEEDSKNKKWDILRDDYMMGAKMKDWDKESDSENPQSDNDIDSGSESG